MARWMDLLKNAVWSRKTTIRQEKRYRKTTMWTFFSRKMTKSISKGEDAINKKEKIIQNIHKLNFFSLPEN